MSIEKRLPNAAIARAFTKTQISAIREYFAKSGDLDGLLVGTNGSYARGEASAQSDLDFFVICKNPNQVEGAKRALKEVAPKLIKIAGRNPSTDGAFGHVEDIPTILTNIGGNDDLNQKITRRVLLLLEGEWLNDQAMLMECRASLLERYIRPKMTSHQLALFLLNDIIRYYRTVCVDFEFKTVEDDKDWGIRNIKLVFSRKLLYFSGVLAVAETMQRSREEKLRLLQELFSIPVIDRVIKICGDSAFHSLELYDSFLREMASDVIRHDLEKTKEGDRTTEPFRRLKDEGHHFSWRLMSLFRQTYDISHPIHRLIFL
ncbi:MAG: nucleotidyltransferase domain-containing protein [Pseudolabrys sp.]|nr:nucleotidyltransferase domain-containing protein [Pseudolabrys sp.]MDP2294482.1 nucleotidyltransferase domain-containing protein [Pseudolabrys sp.]